LEVFILPAFALAILTLLYFPPATFLTILILKLLILLFVIVTTAITIRLLVPLLLALLPSLQHATFILITTIITSLQPFLIIIPPISPIITLTIIELIFLPLKLYSIHLQSSIQPPTSFFFLLPLIF